MVLNLLIYCKFVITVSTISDNSLSHPYPYLLNFKVTAHGREVEDWWAPSQASVS